MATWISLYRQIQNHWIWEDANKLKWWLDILLTVNNAPAKVNLGNELYECNRGQSLLSIQSWSQRWGVSKDTARNFLKLLEKDDMIVLENITKSTRLTVCKFDDYQSSLHAEQTGGKRSPNAKRPLPDPNNKDNKEDKLNNDNKTPLQSAFDDFLEMRKKTKKPATEKAIKLLKSKLWDLSGKDEVLAINILNQSILNNWQDVFPLRQDKINLFQQASAPNPTQPIDHSTR